MQQDHTHLRLAFRVAEAAKAKGNLPYGCLLVDAAGQVFLEGENSINTTGDVLGHAEINLIREACRHFGRDFLRECTIYTSDEPCPMCAGAIYWSGIGRLVYGLSKARHYDAVGREGNEYWFEIPVREVFARGGRSIQVTGPLLEDEAERLHE